MNTDPESILESLGPARRFADPRGPTQARIDRAKHAKFLGIMKKKGVKMTDMSAMERQRWAKAMPNIAKEWADRLEARKIPGRAVLSAFMDEMRARKIDIARQWDRE